MSRFSTTIETLKVSISTREIACSEEADYKSLKAKCEHVAIYNLMDRVTAVPIYQGKEIIGCAAPVGWYPRGPSVGRHDEHGLPVQMESRMLVNAYLPREFEGEIVLTNGNLVVAPATVLET